MSILEQVKELREFAEYNALLEDRWRKMINQAADTIEAMSAKVAVANMERSDRYYWLNEIIEKLEFKADESNDKILASKFDDDKNYYDGKEDGIRFAIDLIKSSTESVERHYGGADLISKSRLLEDFRQKIYPEMFGERCNSLDVIFAVKKVIDEQKERHCIGGWIVSTVIHQNVILDERLKDKRTSILITCETLKGRRYVDEVYCNCGRVENQFNGSIVAWRFLPKPYNPKE